MSDQESAWLKVVFLGGVDEIGNSCLLIESVADAILIDFGKGFSSKQNNILPEIDMVFSVADKLRGLFLTHGHEDHTGGCGFFADQFPTVPIFASAETINFITHRNSNLQSLSFSPLAPQKSIQLEGFELFPFEVSHSVPGAFGYAISFAGQTIVVPGDFCFDGWPQVSDDWCSWVYEKSGKNITMLAADSTNVLYPTRKISEVQVRENLTQIFAQTEGHLFASCFSSNIERIEALLAAAQESGRKVYVDGTSLKASTQAGKAAQRKLFNAAPFPSFFEQLPTTPALVLLSGSQGEEGGALHKLATSPELLQPQDALLLSATAVPGNEQTVISLLNSFAETGIKLYLSPSVEVHASGHASSEELCYAFRQLQPDYIVPVHGEPYMRQLLKQVAEKNGFSPSQLLLPERGDALLFEGGELRSFEKMGEKKELDPLSVHKEKSLAKDGIAVAFVPRRGCDFGVPSIVVRGFLKKGSTAPFLEEAASYLEGCAQNAVYEGIVASSALREVLQQELTAFFIENVGSAPIVVVDIVEINF